MQYRSVIWACLAVACVGCGSKGSSTPDAGPPPTDQCTGVADTAIFEGLVDTDGGVPNIGMMVYDPDVSACGRSPDCVPFIFAEDVPGAIACTKDCLATKSNPLADLSDDCFGCQITVTSCAVHQCTTECAGSDTSACFACVDAQCSAEFVSCTGLAYAPPPL